MNDFEYQRPASLKQALAALAALEDSRPIAGGQSLLPAMKLGLAAPAGLVDLSAIGEMRGITSVSQTVRIGGYSEYWSNLSPELRESILIRTEH